MVSPFYFGPNAFPVPDMMDGTTSGDLKIEAVGNRYWGFQGDRTADVSLRLSLPLFTDRANLTVWMPVVECWENTLERQRTCGLRDDAVMRGAEAGDVYVSTDIRLLQSERHWVDASLRAAMKTASGNGFSTRRYYDCPGYFFDVSVAKPLFFPDSFFKEVRFAASAGFLCWQTDNGRQNDAVMYGAMLTLRSRNCSFKGTFGGYTGWENHASAYPEINAGDCPMTLKADMILHCRHFDLMFRYQYGLRDWPFHHFGFGIAYDFPLF